MQMLTDFATYCYSAPQPSLVPTPDPKHLVCDKSSNILCVLQDVMGVVMAGVTGTRMDELIRAAHMKVGRIQTLCVVFVARETREMESTTKDR